jgi:hypothetical protein
MAISYTKAELKDPWPRLSMLCLGPPVDLPQPSSNAYAVSPHFSQTGPYLNRALSKLSGSHGKGRLDAPLALQRQNRLGAFGELP